MAKGRKMNFENFSSLVDGFIDWLVSQGKGTCETCEFNFGGICADAHYGERITDYHTIRDCWSIGPKEYSRRREEIEKNNDLEKLTKEAYEIYFYQDKTVALQYVLSHLSKLSFADLDKIEVSLYKTKP